MQGICAVCPVFFALSVVSLWLTVPRGRVAPTVDDSSIRQRPGAMQALLLWMWHAAAIVCALTLEVLEADGVPP
jgi:hypothetical protein